jgi:hypothetical protein
MAKQLTPMPVQYITEENGRKVGVVLKWADYVRLLANSEGDPDILAGLTYSELEALAHSKLASERQDRLGELLARQDAGALSDDESRELDRLLDQIDQLNILKARALGESNGRKIADESASDGASPGAVEAIGD